MTSPHQPHKTLATLQCDTDGYLENFSDWNESIAELLAQQENIILSQAHWEILRLVQKFYQEFDHAPSNRPLVRFARDQLGPEKGNSLYLLSLFPSSPPKIAAKIAGLPRPANCL